MRVCVFSHPSIVGVGRGNGCVLMSLVSRASASSWHPFFIVTSSSFCRSSFFFRFFFVFSMHPFYCCFTPVFSFSRGPQNIPFVVDDSRIKWSVHQLCTIRTAVGRVFHKKKRKTPALGVRCCIFVFFHVLSSSGTSTAVLNSYIKIKLFDRWPVGPVVQAATEIGIM